MNRHLQNELQHICPSEADIPPCDFTLQVIKSRLQCKQRTAVPPLACSCPEHSGYRGWEVFDAILISPMLPTRWISQIFLVISYFKALSQRDLVHTLGTFCWRFPQSIGLALYLQSKLMLNTDQTEIARAHSPYWTADSVQMTPFQN